MSYTIHCYLTKLAHVGDRKIQYKQYNSALHKMFPIPTKNVEKKKERVCRTEFTVILENFRMWG